MYVHAMQGHHVVEANSQLEKWVLLCKVNIMIMCCILSTLHFSWETTGLHDHQAQFRSPNLPLHELIQRESMGSQETTCSYCIMVVECSEFKTVAGTYLIRLYNSQQTLQYYSTARGGPELQVSKCVQQLLLPYIPNRQDLSKL